MNIIYFHTHDMGRCCAPYGYKIETPNIQRFAEDGVVFRNAFCIAPTCSPSRAALVTGQYPHQNGMLGLASESKGDERHNWRLNDYSKHFAQFFKDKGYETVLAGSQHEDGFPPTHLPYDIMMNLETAEGQNRFITTDAAIDYLRGTHKRPFFMAIGYDNNHHHRWEETNERMQEFFGEADGRYLAPLPHLPDTAEIRHETSEFYRAVRYVDLQLGRVLQTLRETGLEKDTLIFFTTDHGIGLPHAKKNLTDAGCGVALIIKFPDGLEKGKVVDSMVTHLDVYPTLCEIIGADKPKWLEGVSLMPLIQGEESELHEEVFLQQNFHGTYVPLRGIRTKRYKYIKRYGESRSRAYFSTDGGVAFDFLVANGYDTSECPSEQLFDLYFDTQEAHNLIDDPKYAAIAQDMRARLDGWQREKNDPILRGELDVF